MVTYFIKMHNVFKCTFSYEQPVSNATNLTKLSQLVVSGMSPIH